MQACEQERTVHPQRACNVMQDAKERTQGTPEGS